MFDILLDEEIGKFLPHTFHRDRIMIARHKKTCEAQKKHTLKQVIEWGNRTCIQHNRYYTGLSVEVNTKKRECHRCWAELPKEAEK